MSPFISIILIDGIVLAVVLLIKGLEIRKLLNPNLIKAYVRMPNRKWQIFYANKVPTKTGWQFRLKGHKVAYHIDKECIDYMGLLRMPTGHWNYNKSDMINFDKLEASSAVASNDYYEQTQHHVFTDLMYTLKKEFFTPAMSLMIIVAVLFVGFFFIYQQTSDTKQSIRQIQDQLVPQEVVNAER